MARKNLATFGMVALCFVGVLALFGVLIFPMFFDHVETLHKANSDKGLGFGLTDSEKNARQAVLWLLYVGMLATAGAVPFLVGKLRGISTETLLWSLLSVLLLVAVLSLPVLLFAGTCNDLFSAMSC